MSNENTFITEVLRPCLKDAFSLPEASRRKAVNWLLQETLSDFEEEREKEYAKLLNSQCLDSDGETDERRIVACDEMIAALRAYLSRGGYPGMKFSPGTRVELTADVERYPDFIVKKGALGTVTYNRKDAIHIKLDTTITHPDEHGKEQPAAVEWDNEIHWYRDDLLDCPQGTLLEDIVAETVQEL